MPAPKPPTVTIKYVEKNANGNIKASIDKSEGPVLLLPVEKK